MLVVSKTFFALHKQKNGYQARVFVVAKATSIVLDTQNSKCLPDKRYPDPILDVFIVI